MYTLITYWLQSLKINQKSLIYKKTLTAITGILIIIIIIIILYLQDLQFPEILCVFP